MEDLNTTTPLNTVQELLCMQREIHGFFKERGYWEKNRAQTESVYLGLIRDLIELDEAYALQKYAIKSAIETLSPVVKGVDLSSLQTGRAWFLNQYSTYIKDSVQDRMARAVIRVLDIAKGYKINLNQPYINRFPEHVTSKENILHLISLVVLKTAGKLRWRNILWKLIDLSNKEDIELATFIQIRLMFLKIQGIKPGSWQLY